MEAHKPQWGMPLYAGFTNVAELMPDDVHGVRNYGWYLVTACTVTREAYFLSCLRFEILLEEGIQLISQHCALLTN